MEANVSTYKTHFFLSSINLPLPDIYKIPLNIENVAPAKKKNTGSNCNNKSYNFISNIVWICENCGHTLILALFAERKWLVPNKIIFLTI